MNKTKVAVYIRVSTNSVEQAETYEAQHNHFSNYFVDTEFELVHIYADKKSGTSAKKRPSFLQMVYDAGVNWKVEQGKLIFYRDLHREPLFKTIYVPTLSRFGRDILIVDALRELRLKDVNVISIEGALDSSKEADFKHMELYFWIAQQESVMKSERMIQALDRSAKAGKLFINRLYGYDYADGKLTINEKQAEVVREVYSLYLQGYGIRRIARQLNSNNAPTYSNKPEWKEYDIKRIVTNPKYCGRLIRNAVDYGKIFQKHAPKKRDAAFIKDDHDDIEPIISVETFEQAQAMYYGKVQSVSNRGIYRGTSDYAGLIVCNNCGSTYTANTGRNKKPIFNCSGKKRRGVSFCNNSNISLSKLELELQGLADHALSNLFSINKEDLVLKLEDKRDQLTNAIDEQDMQLVSELDDELLKIKERKKRLSLLYAGGKMEEEVLDELLDQANFEMQEVEQRKAEASKTNADILAEREELNLMIYDLMYMKFNSDVSTIADVLKHISKITVIEGNLFYRFKMFEHLPEVKHYEYKDMRLPSDY
jgi:site-specific DNA recombinase